MVAITTEIMLAVAVIVLTVLAIIVYISSGSSAWFYGIFVVTIVVMFYMWHKISGTTEMKENVAMPETAKRTRKRAGAKRRQKRRKA